jgi:glutamate-1-semialdehyde 2,1-aminomutase
LAVELLPATLSDMVTTGLDRDLLLRLKEAEDARFVAERPKTMELLARGERVMPNGVPMGWMTASYHHPPMFVAQGKGSRFTDVDGHSYADFNIADMSLFCGYAPEPVVQAVSQRMAAGNQFLLPTEDAIWVSEELQRRYGLPKWQYTLSATQANTELIRVSRVATGRDKVLMFEGKYHGHFDEALVERHDGKLVPEESGLPSDVTRNTVLVPFNDPEALERALETREIAVVLTEPAMTNNNGLILPEPGFHEALRAATRATGTLLALDETHTQVCGPGGLSRIWGLQPDLVSSGKSIAGGVPFGTYGMTREVAAVLHQGKSSEGEREQLVATGGTLFGNALSMAAARATFAHVLTEDAYARTALLGSRLADGMEAAVGKVGLPWHIHRLYPRSGCTFAPQAPRDAREAEAVANPLLVRLIRIWLANRGVWEAIVGAGPVVPIPGTEEDVDLYVEAFGELLVEITRK